MSEISDFPKPTGRRNGSTIVTVILFVVIVGLIIGALQFVGGGQSLLARFYDPDKHSSASNGLLRRDPLPVLPLKLKKVPNYDQIRSYTGKVKPSRRSQLSFQRLDKIETLYVDQGDRVVEGDLLAQLEMGTLEAKLKELEGKSKEAKAVLQELENGPREEVINRQKSLVMAEKARVDELLDKVQRNRALGSAAVKAEVKQTEFALKGAKANAEAAEHKLKELKAGVRQEKKDAQKAIVTQLNAALESVEINIKNSFLHAPYDAHIVSRNADEGSVASPGETIFEIVEDGQLEAWIGVPASATLSLSVGAKYSVVVRGTSFPATVRSISADLDSASLTRTVVLDFDSATTDEIAIGEVARIEIQQTVQREGFWVPATALTGGTNGLWAVLSISESKDNVMVAKRQEVEVLHTDGERKFIRGTIQDGDTIVANGIYRLASNQLVVIQEEQTLEQDTENQTPADSIESVNESEIAVGDNPATKVTSNPSADTEEIFEDSKSATDNPLAVDESDNNKELVSKDSQTDSPPVSSQPAATKGSLNTEDKKGSPDFLSQDSDQ